MKSFAAASLNLLDTLDTLQSEDHKALIFAVADAKPGA
jgi:hypothetical protein